MRTARASAKAQTAQHLIIGLSVGVVGALAIQQARALTNPPTHTTTRYFLEGGAVTDLAGEPAGAVEAAKWKEMGDLNYDLKGRSVRPSVARWTLVLRREAP